MTRMLVVLVLLGCNQPGFRPRIVQHDRIVQVAPPGIDVLWAIDNSCSMSEFQRVLADSFPSFAQFFVGTGLDYHIGVVTTDGVGELQAAVETGNGVLFIDKDTPNPETVFAEMAEVGVSGSGREQGFGSIYEALGAQRDAVNAGYYRESASLHTIVISDESDQTSAELITLTDFVIWYSTLKATGIDRTFSAIVHPIEGLEYIQVSDSIRGTTHSIQEFPWDVVLEELGLHAAGAIQEYFLSLLPVPDSIAVWIDEDGANRSRDEFIVDQDWIYDAERNSVTFINYAPPPLSGVNIEYVVSSSN